MQKHVKETLNELRKEASELIDTINKVEAGKENVEYITYKAWHIEELRRQLKFLIKIEKKDVVKDEKKMR